MAYNAMRETIASLVRCGRKVQIAGPRAACSQRIRVSEIAFRSKRGSRMTRIVPRMAGTLAIVVSLGACVMPPTIPTIPVAPGPNKNFEAFSADQAFCQQYATAQTAPQAYATTNQAVGTAILTTALGAALGGAIGGGHAAGIGAASGAAFGMVVGAGGSGFAQMSLQQQFDIMYGQCMYAYGNQVPGFSPPPGTPPYPGVPGASSYGSSSYGPAPYGPPPYGPPPR
jgi:outer membrane lipoprotein SlyB